MKTLIVTGGSRAICAGISRGAAADGWNVCVNYATDQDAAGEVVKDIESVGGSAIAVRADVSNEAHVDELFDQATERLGPVTGLVNNAGIMGSGSSIDEMDVEKSRQMFEVNLLGPMICCRAALRRISTRYGGSGGAIVNISFGAALHGGIGSYIDFATSKAALDRFSTAAGQEQVPHGVRINSLRPGLIMTDGNRQWSETHPEWLASVLERTPVGRAGEVKEVAAVTSWLLSDEARFVTGAILDVSGGFAVP